jgi:glucose/mannose transport system substrate-binding protein
MRRRAQFNTSRQFRDFVEQGLLNNVDDASPLPASGTRSCRRPSCRPSRSTAISTRRRWTSTCPAWFFIPMAVQEGRIGAEPQSWDILQQLAKLKAAGVVPPGLRRPGRQKITFDAIFAMVGGADLYLRVWPRPRPEGRDVAGFPQVLVDLKKLKGLRGRRLAGPQLERRHCHGRAGAGRADHGRLGQGRHLPPPSRWRARTGCFGFGPKARTSWPATPSCSRKRTTPMPSRRQSCWPMW